MLIDHLLLSSLRATLALTTAAVVGSFAFGVPLGWLVARGLPHRAGLWQPLLAWPFAIPASVAALQALPLLDSLGWSYTARAVVAVMIALNAPFVALRTAQAWRQLDPRLLEQAAALGAGPGSRFARVVAPALRPAWAGAAAEVYLACVHSLSLVLLLGGGPPVETVEVTLYYRLQGGGLDWVGSLLAGAALLVLSLPAAVLLAAQAGAQARDLFRPAEVSYAPISPLQRRVGWLSLAVLSGIWILPLLRGGHIPAADRAEYLRSLFSSMGFAAAVVVGLLLMAITFVRRVHSPRALAWTAGLAAAASAVSPMLLALGIIYAQILVGRDPFAYPRVALAVALSLHFLPFAVRNLIWLQMSRPVALLEVARVSGASARTAWWQVEWPRWRPSVQSAGALLFLWVLGESALTWLFTTGSKAPWITALLARWAGQYRVEAAQAGAWGLLVLTAVGFLGLHLKRGVR